MTSSDGMNEREWKIANSLRRCHIKVVRGKVVPGNFPDTVVGELEGFQFFKLSYYWTVVGNVPLAVAKELYDDPVGRTDIRVVGHTGAPSPDKWVKYIDKDGRTLDRFVEDPSVEGKPYITSYHIDSETGLRVFVDTLRRHELV